MSKDLATKNQAHNFEQALIGGNLSNLTPEQCIAYYNQICESLNLNPLTQPFEYIVLNGKKVLYAKRSCTEQLRKNHGVSVTITSREKIDDIFVVSARATDASGRSDESVGAVSISGLKGEALANAMMKAETKAKRRVTLSICGLAFLDESEVGSIPAKPVMEKAKAEPPITPQIEEEKFPWESKEQKVLPKQEYRPENYIIQHGAHSGVMLRDKPKEFWLEYLGQIKSKLGDLDGEAFDQATVLMIKIETYLEQK